MKKRYIIENDEICNFNHFYNYGYMYMHILYMQNVKCIYVLSRNTCLYNYMYILCSLKRGLRSLFLSLHVSSSCLDQRQLTRPIRKWNVYFFSHILYYHHEHHHHLSNRLFEYS